MSILLDLFIGLELALLSDVDVTFNICLDEARFMFPPH